MTSKSFDDMAEFTRMAKEVERILDECGVEYRSTVNVDGTPTFNFVDREEWLSLTQASQVAAACQDAHSAGKALGRLEMWEDAKKAARQLDAGL